MYQIRISDFGTGDADFNNFAMVILLDAGSQLLQRRNSVVATLIRWNVRWLVG